VRIKPARPLNKPPVQKSKAPRKYLLVSNPPFPDASDVGATRTVWKSPVTRNENMM